MHFAGIEINADFAVSTTEAVDLAHTGQALHLTLDHVINIPGQLLQRHAGCLDGIGLDGLALYVDLLDDGFVNAAGEIRTDLGNSVLDVIKGLVGWHLKTELDGRHGAAVRHGGGDVLHPGNAGTPRLQCAS